MQISPIGTGLLPGLASDRPKSAVSLPATRSATIATDNAVRPASPSTESRLQALSILRQEIRQALQTSFRIRFSAPAQGYEDARRVNAADVAADALNGAAAAAKRSPVDASRVLVDMRGKLQQKANEVREIVGNDRRLDNALSRIDSGFDELDADAARNVTSSASVLAVESRTRQRSTIQVRTQEGDIVRFDLRRVETMSAEDISIQNGDSSYTSTGIEVSSRSRVRLRVEGDLNDAEYAAVRNVFAQAEAIADEFFAGDIAAAFDIAAGLEFDQEQLARVKIRFREKLQSEVSYAAIGPVLNRPAATPAPATEPVLNRPATTPSPAIEPEQPANLATDPVAPIPTAPPVLEQAPVLEPDPENANAGADTAAPTPIGDALEGFFDLLSDFLRATATGFEPEPGATSFRYFYSQSFNLQILRSVLEVTAPDEERAAADSAATIIEGIAGTPDDD